MDSLLCDELLQEIFHRLPSSSSSSVSLVSKRWLHLLRSSTSTLSLTFTPSSSSSSSSSVSCFLSSHPYLSSLSLNLNSTYPDSDHLLRSVAFSCPNLKHLRFLLYPVSLPPLLLLSSSCPHLSSLKIALSRPLIFTWLTCFHSLKHLKLIITTTTTGTTQTDFFQSVQPQLLNCQQHSEEFNLHTLSISGIRVGDNSLNWLWRNCKHLKKLKLAACQSVGDDPSFSDFIKSVKGLQQVELRTSRTIVDRVLLRLAEYCVSLDSLSVYDGGSKTGLLQFIVHNRCRLKKLHLRLPLDLDDDHLFAMAENFTLLSSLRLQSCCLVTGEGLKTVASRMNNVLDELSLTNCGAIQRESGLLTTLGQALKNLKMVDLSYNEKLTDKELTSMMVSCSDLKELKLRGCSSLSDAALTSLIRCCKKLEVMDLAYCSKMSGAAIEAFVMKCRDLREMHIEVNKVSVGATTGPWASTKYIQIV